MPTTSPTTTSSNETAYLQTAPQLPKVVKPGGAFIGVGPEQNFSYIALTRPDVAFVVDIRRRNMLLHLLYKAIFKEATSRSHFLATLLGRPYEAEGDPGENATIEQVMAHATKLPKSKERFDALHNQLRQRITDEYGFKLVYTDRAAIKSAHREFYDKQLDIHFELHVKSKRDYPTLQTLLTVADPSGSQTGFLASEKSFRLIQKMHEQDRIIPVVGDFRRRQGPTRHRPLLRRKRHCAAHLLRVQRRGVPASGQQVGQVDSQRRRLPDRQRQRLHPLVSRASRPRSPVAARRPLVDIVSCSTSKTSVSVRTKAHSARGMTSRHTPYWRPSGLSQTARPCSEETEGSQSLTSTRSVQVRVAAAYPWTSSRKSC